jgi:hypothetical protein
LKNVVAEYMKKVASKNDEITEFIQNAPNFMVYEIANMLDINTDGEFYHIDDLDEVLSEDKTQDEIDKIRDELEPNCNFFYVDWDGEVYGATKSEVEQEIRDNCENLVIERLSDGVDNEVMSQLPKQLREILEGEELH